MSRKRQRIPQEKWPAIHADLRQRFGLQVTRQELLAYKEETGIFPGWIAADKSLRLRWGVYQIPDEGYVPSAAAISESEDDVSDVAEVEVPEIVPESIETAEDTTRKAQVFAQMDAIRKQASLLAAIPPKDPAFVEFGDYEMVEQIISSRQFFPVFITGMSGNGKTFQVEQACAKLGREYVRVNITAETDEDDLIGGFRLVDGNTRFELGPVVVAMLRGAVLLVDEIDYASPKIACIQSVLEGKRITIKKLGITISPEKGFTVFATANTKGRGDEQGKYVGANLLNEAFLDRFPITVEQAYPDVATEKRILARNYTAAGYQMTDHARTFFDTLAKWAAQIRKSYDEQAVEDLVATRRLCHIARAYGIFKDDCNALAYCVNRYDPKTRDAFSELYNKLAPDAAAKTTRGNLDGEDVKDPDF